MIVEESENAGVIAAEGYRSRTARRRRHETKRRLVEALFGSIDRDGFDSLSIDELRHECQLSRGAFYRYFPTLESMLVTVSSGIGARINQEMSSLFDTEPNAVRRLSYHCRYFIKRAASDQACARLLLWTMPMTVAVSEQALRHAKADFVEAQANGCITVPDVEVAVELGHSLQLGMLRRAVVHGLDLDKLSAGIEIMLRGFGLEHDLAASIAYDTMPPLDTLDLRKSVLESTSEE